MKTRASGILLHISSLPSKYGIGDLGPQAYKFADFLRQAKQRYWQVLPINQLSSKGNYSPYNCLSAFAGSFLLISPERLIQDGFLTRKDVRGKPDFPKAKVDYRRVASFKKRLLDIAYKRFKAKVPQKKYQQFCLDNADWLEDYATFTSIRQSFGNSLWCTWPTELRNRNPAAVNSMKRQSEDAINEVKFQQYIFFKQWLSLKNYCNTLGIRVIGDVPFYVSYNSADVWKNHEFFKLTKSRKPRFIAGVPPDLYSRNGQLWGNPVYNWKALERTDFLWWLQRIAHNLALFDTVRLDHFRGFAGFWQVQAGSKTAKNGKWVRGPKEDFLNKLFECFPSSRFIAEDLGYITAEVRGLIEKYQLTCTKVLMFGFDGDCSKNPHCPHNYVRNSIIYTGTHDNNTVRGWFENDSSAVQRRKLFDYIGYEVPPDQIHWEFIRLAMSSISNVVIIPMQDILGLGSHARMNHPSTIKNNWQWRITPGQLRSAICEKLAKITEIYGRC